MTNKYFICNFNAKEITKILNKASQKLKNLTPVMKVAKVFLKNTIDKNFETEGKETGDKWPAWSEKYKKQRIKMGFSTGKILNLRAHLRRSIMSKHTVDTALVGTNCPYAAIHNFGGDKSLRHNKNMPKREIFRLNENKKDELYAEIYLAIEERILKEKMDEIENFN